MPQTYLVFLPEKAKLEKLEELVCKRNERKPCCKCQKLRTGFKWRFINWKDWSY